MVKMVSLKRTEAERKADREALGEPVKQPDGIDIHLDHHHLKKLGIEELPDIGHKHVVHARGEVTRRSEDEDGAGENRRLTLRVTHMGIEPDSADKDEDSTAKDADDMKSRGELRSDIRRIAEESEAKAAEKAKLKAARTGGKVAEKADGK